MKARVIWLFAALALLSGCGTRATDYPLTTGQVNQPQPEIDANPDHPFVVLTFSGGGSRAAVLAAALVDRLNRLQYTAAGASRPLAADIAAVSSVSGGSVYAADLGLRGPEHAGDFMRRLGQFDGIGWLVRRALNPFTWLSLQLESKTRIDVLQEMIEDVLQTNATMAALNQPGKQLTLLNATDMVAGQVFTFDRSTIDDLCMDYDKVPVSLGVTASAAFPIAFTPVLLRNDSYSPGCPTPRAARPLYKTALQAANGPYANLETYRTARYRQSLRNEKVREPGSTDDVPPFRNPEFVRLVDGGVADNSGLTSLRRALLSPTLPMDIGRLAAQGKLRHLVVIAVNARSDPPNPLDKSARYTSVPTMANSISGTLVDSASANSAAVFQNFIKQLTYDRDDLMRQGQTQASFSIYPISIDFDQLPNGTVAEQNRQQRVKNIATSWTLQSGDVELLNQVAGQLLWRHPCFRALVADIRLRGTPEADPVPGAACPVKQPGPARRGGSRNPA